MPAQTKPVPTFDAETVYDEQIAPLMYEIVRICQRNDIPMLASFCYGAEDGEPMLCTTALVENPRTPKKFLDAQAIIFARPKLMAFALSNHLIT